jgi:sugar-specific transcriptional regulator TrmB
MVEVEHGGSVKRDVANRATLPEDDIIARLVEIGLTITQGRVYAALLEMPGHKPPEIADRAGISRTKIYQTLQHLEAYGFATSEGNYRLVYRPVPPREAVPAWIEARQGRRRLEQERDDRTGRELVDLLPQAGGEPTAAGTSEFETIAGEGRASAMLPNFGRRTKHSLDMMITAPFAQHRSEWNVVESQALARGVRVRIIIDARVMNEQVRIKEAVEIGAAVRVRQTNPIKMLIRDEAEIAIQLREPPPKKGVMTLLVRQQDVIEGFVSLFERAWEDSADITLDGAGALHFPPALAVPESAADGER